ncbi:MAG TPA: SLC13 family permease [Blastocatellia bacterium]|nr:SLC13 family permease [Blastocatellia bacterium]
MLSAQQISFLVILIVASLLLVTERMRNDVVAVLIVLALAITRVLSPSEALSGFGSEPALVVVSIFVMSAAFHQTGLAERIGDKIGVLAGKGYTRIITVVMGSVALLSAFTHHVTTTALMLPVTLSLSRERNIPASKLLMPLSFAASLGTAITIIGAPAFLVADDVLRRGGRPALGIFSIAPIGLSISAVGILFMVLIGRFLLPSREGAEDLKDRFRLDSYFTELKIQSESAFIGKSLTEIKKEGHYQFTVVGWVRHNRRLRGSFAEQHVREEDVLLMHATPEDIVAFRQEDGIELHPIDKYGSDSASEANLEDISDHLVQVVIGPNSEVIGRTLGEIDFRRRYQALVIGLWRREGLVQEELARVRLKAGDVLLVQGGEEPIATIASDPAFLLMVPFHGESKPRRKARLTAGIMLGTIALAAFNLLSLDIITLSGATAMVLSRCITSRQAYKAIDARIYVFIAGAIPLGAAMQKSGTAALIAGGLEKAVANWPPMLVLLAIFAIVGIVTQFMSDAATTALFAPVAFALAQGLGRAPEPYIVTVAMAAVTSFLTPIGHHGNLLVYGPGRYQFVDFIKVGTPLTILVAVVVTSVCLAIWPG